jgi:hypothetical protein
MVSGVNLLEVQLVVILLLIALFFLIGILVLLLPSLPFLGFPDKVLQVLNRLRRGYGRQELVYEKVSCVRKGCRIFDQQHLD